jgi:2-(1,2-epoxy-1,2-dihydrophenyl)acetyl-CoA isomerase
MSYDTMQLTVDNGLARLVLNQPQLGNPFNAAMCADMNRVATELQRRGDVRAVLLTANGKFFTVGGDIRMFVEQLDALPGKILEWTAGLHMGMARLKRLNAPLVASVHGVCMGGGVALAGTCDLVYAGRSAKFGAAYPQIGYSVDAGASFALASRMGIARARRFMLFNEMLGADEALTVGLADFVVDDAVLAETAEKAARQLAAGPTRAFGEIRRLIDKALRTPFESQLEDEAQALSGCAGSTDAREGILAFVEKRTPNFQGR